MWKEAFLQVSHFSLVEKVEKCGLDVKTLCGGLDLSWIIAPKGRSMSARSSWHATLFFYDPGLFKVLVSDVNKDKRNYVIPISG